MSERPRTTVFIGGGNMATALIGGRVAVGASSDEFRVVEPSLPQRDALIERFPSLRVFAEPTGDVIEHAAVVVFAVKPQNMRAAAIAVAPHVRDVGVVLTIAAGIRTIDLSRWLGGYGRIVRAMPNTPALVGAGISGVYAAPNVDANARDAAAAILRAGGDIVWCDDETALDAVTGVSGSGPAYVFYFLESLEKAALALGFSSTDARRLAYATFSGAMALAQKSDAEPSVLRAQVTSKGGTTERAIAMLESRGVKESIVAAVKEAETRARELGEEFGKDD